MGPHAPLLAPTLALLLLPAVSVAHEGTLPAVAIPLTPVGACTVTDGSFEITWTDADEHEEGRIAWYYALRLPPPFLPHEKPADLTGTLIVDGLAEADPDNRLSWDTSSVPAGTYWLWSHTWDPPYDTRATSLGVVTVAHPGDEGGPAIAVLQDHDEPEGHVDTEYVVRYSARDPSGDGRVRLQATPEPGGHGLGTLADDLPAVEEGAWTWDVSRLDVARWSVRALLLDPDGRTRSEAWGRYFVTVYRRSPGAVDPWEPDDDGYDGPVDPWTQTAPPAPEEGCEVGACATEANTWQHVWLLRRR